MSRCGCCGAAEDLPPPACHHPGFVEREIIFFVISLMTYAIFETVLQSKMAANRAVACVVVVLVVGIVVLGDTTVAHAYDDAYHVANAGGGQPTVVLSLEHALGGPGSPFTPRGQLSLPAFTAATGSVNNQQIGRQPRLTQPSLSSADLRSLQVRLATNILFG